MTNIKMSLAISKFKSIFKNQICHKRCKIHAYKFAFHGEHSVGSFPSNHNPKNAVIGDKEPKAFLRAE